MQCVHKFGYGRFEVVVYDSVLVFLRVVQFVLGLSKSLFERFGRLGPPSLQPFFQDFDAFRFDEHGYRIRIFFPNDPGTFDIYL